MKQMLSIKEVAQHLDVSEDTVYRMIQQREIGYLKIRNQFRIPLRTLEEWIDRRLVKVHRA